MHQTNKVAAIHDLSGVGRCSLAVIVPILSIMKSQVCAIPTTILSSHTGGLGVPVIHDLPGYVINALHHYQQLQLEFNCIYSGYLGDGQHFLDSHEFFLAYPSALKVVDPVMGDHGRIYQNITKERIALMIDLVQVADLITPNMTEVYLLLQEAYSSEPLSLLAYEDLLRRLSDLGPNRVVITGAPIVGGKIVNLGFDRTTDTCVQIPCYYSEVSYPGTGDMFAATLIGGLLQGKTFADAIEVATRFLEYVIHATTAMGTDSRYGVELEQHLAWLIQPHIDFEHTVFHGYRKKGQSSE